MTETHPTPRGSVPNAAFVRRRAVGHTSHCPQPCLGTLWARLGTVGHALTSVEKSAPSAVDGGGVGGARRESRPPRNQPGSLVARELAPQLFSSSARSEHTEDETERDDSAAAHSAKHHQERAEQASAVANRVGRALLGCRQHPHAGPERQNRQCNANQHEAGSDFSRNDCRLTAGHGPTVRPAPGKSKRGGSGSQGTSSPLRIAKSAEQKRLLDGRFAAMGQRGWARAQRTRREWRWPAMRGGLMAKPARDASITPLRALGLRRLDAAGASPTEYLLRDVREALASHVARAAVKPRRPRPKSLQRKRQLR